MGPYYLLGIGSFLCNKHNWLFFPALEVNKSFLILKKTKFFCNVINPILTKLDRSRWLYIHLIFFFFFIFLDLDFVSVHKCAKQKKELGRYPAIWTSRSVTDAYIMREPNSIIVSLNII